MLNESQAQKDKYYVLSLILKNDCIELFRLFLNVDFLLHSSLGSVFLDHS